MSQKKARIKDVAKLAGVSIGTVDRVIHNRGEVAIETRLKVESVLKETNYSPDLMAQVLKSRKIFNITSLLPEPNELNSYWKKHPVGMTKAIKDLEPFHVILNQVTFDIQNEEDFQKKTIEVLKNKPDGVILAPIFKTQSIAFCSNLTKENIPFIFVDGYLENTEFLTYTGEDTFKSGRVAGQLTDMITDPKRDILIIVIARNIKNVHHLNNRTQGFIDYLEKSGTNKGKKLIINIPEPTDKSIKLVLDKTLKENPETGSIFMTGSRSFLLAAYLEKKRLNNINLVGYDLLEENVRYLKSGAIKFLIGQRPEEQTNKGVKKLFEFLSKHKTPEKIEYLPIDVVTSENVDFYI
jgi:LacI family transcriptional regulator